MFPPLFTVSHAIQSTTHTSPIQSTSCPLTSSVHSSSFSSHASLSPCNTSPASNGVSPSNSINACQTPAAQHMAAGTSSMLPTSSFCTSPHLPATHVTPPSQPIVVKPDHCSLSPPDPLALRPAPLASTPLAPAHLVPTSLAPAPLAATSLAPAHLVPTSMAPAPLAPTSLAPSDPSYPAYVISPRSGKKYVCTVCGGHFSFVTNARRHFISQHGSKYLQQRTIITFSISIISLIVYTVYSLAPASSVCL